MTWLDLSIESKKKIIYNALKWEKYKEKNLYTSLKDMAEIVDLFASNKINWSSAKMVFFELEDNRKKYAEECHKFIKSLNIDLKDK